MSNSFEEYFLAVKDLRTEFNYDYSDEVLEECEYYFKNCWETNLSIYKSLEFLWFEVNRLAL